MNDQTLSHDDAVALMAGSVPEGRPDLVALAAAIEDFRDAFAEPAPQPSPELAGWLSGAPLAPQRRIESKATAERPAWPHTRPLRRRIRAATRALAALGVAAKIMLGGTAALAAVASAGAVGVLPERPQAVFDRLLHNDHADAPLPHTPLEESQETDTRPEARAEGGSRDERPTEERSPTQNTAQPGGHDDRSPAATSNPPRGGSHPTPETEQTDDSVNSDNERHDDPGDEPGHESGDGPGDGLDEKSDDGPDDGLDEESDDGPDEESDQGFDEGSDDADDHSHVDYREVIDDSSDDAGDGDGDGDGDD